MSKPCMPYRFFRQGPRGVPLPSAPRPWLAVEGCDPNRFVYVFDTATWEELDDTRHVWDYKTPFALLETRTSGNDVLDVLFKDLPRPWFFLGKDEFVAQRLAPRLRALPDYNNLGMDALAEAANDEIARVFGPEPEALTDWSVWEDALEQLLDDFSEVSEVSVDVFYD